MELAEISNRAEEIIQKFMSAAKLKPGNILVVGCSTSEVMGRRIGSGSNMEVARAIFEPIYKSCSREKVFMAVQCCEHLNRSLVVERALAEKMFLEEVSVVPTVFAGGAMAVTAMERFREPLLVEAVSAHAGIDIGLTLIGMHLKRVAVPIRIEPNTIGKAVVVFAATRPKLIGGPRACYGQVLDKRSVSEGGKANG